MADLKVGDQVRLVPSIQNTSMCAVIGGYDKIGTVEPTGFDAKGRTCRVTFATKRFRGSVTGSFDRFAAVK